jgi:hypothetical protein
MQRNGFVQSKAAEEKKYDSPPLPATPNLEGERDDHQRAGHA